jgi:hypothetical protein
MLLLFQVTLHCSRCRCTLLPHTQPASQQQQTQRRCQRLTVVVGQGEAAYCTTTLPAMPAPWWGSQ